MPKTTTTQRDKRIATLAPLLRTADEDQQAAFLALVVDSYALRAVVTAVSDDDEQASSLPKPKIPDLFKTPLTFQDMWGNEYVNWYDYIQAVTNGEFGRISGIGPGPWATD
jgi:hypothetical protein